MIDIEILLKAFFIMKLKRKKGVLGHQILC